MPQTLNIAVCEDEAAETLLLCDILNHSDIQNTYTVFTDADSFLASYEYGKYGYIHERFHDRHRGSLHNP